MHVLQYIAVDADDLDQAMRRVEDELNTALGDGDNLNTWFDWFIVGGGRWNTNEGDDLDESYKRGKTNMVVSYATDKAKFAKTIADCLDNRMTHFAEYQKGLDLSTLGTVFDNYNPSVENYSIFSQIYAVKKSIDIIMGEWGFDSAFYDMTNDSTNPKWCLDKANDSWYLIPVDFHF